MLKETLVSGTQIVQAGFSVLCFGETVSWALAMARKLPLALLALCGQATSFHVGKCHLPFAIHHIQDATVADIAKIVFREYEMVATVYVPVVLHHGGMPAPVGQSADTGCNPCPVGQSSLEGLHEDLSHVIPVPFVEDGTEKFAPCLGRYAEGSHGILLSVHDMCQVAPVAMPVYPLHHRSELQVAALQFVTEEAVGSVRVGDLDGLHAGQEEDHVVAGPAPDKTQDDNGLGGIRVIQPVDRLREDADVHQQGVAHAVVGEQGTEDHGVGNQTGRAGQEDAGAEQAAELEVAVVEQGGEDDRQHQHDRDLDEQVGEGIADGLDEHLVLEHELVVAPERIGVNQVGREALLKGDQQRLEHRPEAEDEDQNRSRGQETPAGRALLALHRPEAMLLLGSGGRIGHGESTSLF